ncbi:MAG TPA: DUF2752 domain-containing protein [Spirochaetota bacterium]|nr:DUF2752 domain-containing protein [Spirochaetota bacterium]HPP05313.1 DUF2752 domain-containing protein [Spirochaetota bacterium]
MKKDCFITKRDIRFFIFNHNLLWVLISIFVLSFGLYFIGEDNFSVCPLMNITHIPCPLCGMSRAFIEFSHLHFFNAIKYNILVIFIFPFFITLFIIQLLPLSIKKKVYKLCIKNINIIRIVLIITIFLFIFHGIIRIIDHFTNIFGFMDLTPKITVLKIIKKILRIY